MRLLKDKSFDANRSILHQDFSSMLRRLASDVRMLHLNHPDEPAKRVRLVGEDGQSYRLDLEQETPRYMILVREKESGDYYLGGFTALSEEDFAAELFSEEPQVPGARVELVGERQFRTQVDLGPNQITFDTFLVDIPVGGFDLVKIDSNIAEVLHENA